MHPECGIYFMQKDDLLREMVLYTLPYYKALCITTYWGKNHFFINVNQYNQLIS
jgi:hypothetical protein